MTPIISRQALYNEAVKNLIPLHCLLELTYNCNLDCVHCYTVNDKEKEELSKQEFFRILEQLKNAGCLYLTLSGGEPLLRKDFFEIAEYAKKLNFALRIFTNGTLINEYVIDKIKRLKPTAVEISLYGLENTHEKITRIKDSFKRTIESINLLKKNGVNALVKCALLKQNIGKIWELKKYIEKQLKAKMRGLGGGLAISPCDDGNRRPLSYRARDDQLRNYFRGEFKQSISLNGDFKLNKVNLDERLCGAGLASCNITPYGEVNPCVQIRLKNNDLKDKSFIDIWKNHKELNKIRNLRMRDKKDCMNCEYLPYCFVCPGIALLEEGSLTAKLPEACRQAKIRKEVYEEFSEKKAVK